MGDAEGWKPLSHEIICECLSLIERTVAGSGYAFTKLNCSEKELTDLGNKVQAYTNLKYVTVSKNQITSLEPVSKLPHVLQIAANENKITQQGITCMLQADLPWCQHLDLSINALTGVVPLNKLGRLRVLDLQQNQIASLESFDGHENIEVLKLQQNQLQSLEGLGKMEKLKKLFISENQISSLKGLDAENLEDLDASKNELASLDFIEGAANILRLNISDNKLQGDDNMPEISKLDSRLLSLQEITASGNPLYDTYSGTEPKGAQTEILLVLPRIQKIDGEAVADEDREQCEKLKKVRAFENASTKKKQLSDRIEDLKSQLGEEVQAKLDDLVNVTKEKINGEFPPLPNADDGPPEGFEGTEEEWAEQCEAVKAEHDPMPKLLKEIALLEEVLAVAQEEADAAGIGAPPPEEADE